MKEETIRAIISINLRLGLGGDWPKNNQERPTKLIFELKRNVLPQTEQLK